MRVFRERRPHLACEFSSTQIVAARASESGLVDKTIVRALDPGVITPDLLGTNIQARDAVRTALQEAVDALDGRDQDMALILPDACCRVVLIDLDVLPEKSGEADVLVRFRLQKSLPFEIEKARVAWQVQNRTGKTTVLAAATLGSVLEEYESVIREAGCSPGLVLPSILASLRQVDARVPTLVVKADPETTSVGIVNQAAVLLLRVLGRQPGSQPEGTQIADQVYPSMVFFEDAYGTKIKKILVGGVGASEELKSALEQASGVSPQELVEDRWLDATCESERSLLGAVGGALVPTA
jgi:type IV pilus assembly protein PilM